MEAVVQSKTPLKLRSDSQLIKLSTANGGVMAPQTAYKTNIKKKKIFCIQYLHGKYMEKYLDLLHVIMHYQHYNKVYS